MAFMSTWIAAGVLLLALVSTVLGRPTGEAIAIEAIDQYLKKCAQIPNVPHAHIPYDVVEKATRDKTGKGWTKEMYANALLHRWNENEPQDTMLSTSVTHLVTNRSAVRVDHGIIHPVENGEWALDVVKEINDIHAQFSAGYHPPGTLVFMEESNSGVAGEAGEAGDGSNIFDTAGYLEAVMQIEGHSDLPPLPEKDNGLETVKIENWIRENVPVLTTKEELAYYGYYKVNSDQTFIMESPVGFWPAIPTYVGDEYSKHIRGGIYLERHAPIHLWSPTTQHAADKGYLLTMAPVADARWDKGWRFDVDNEARSNTPPFGRYRLARIPIGFGETVLAHPYTWHADATLGGGLHLMSFSFGPGPNGDKSDLAAASGFQPIYLPAVAAHAEL